jgi:hypothetical protein
MNSLTDIVNESLKGILIGVLYFETTRVSDTNAKNILAFAGFYILLIFTAHFIHMDTNIITNAFVTKTIFTLVDERLRDDGEPNNEKNKVKPS